MSADRFTPARDFLLISRVGAQSLHASWLGDDAARSFDLLVSAYDQRVEAMKGPGIFFEYRPGRKVAGYADILADHRELLKHYRYVGLIDDDIAADARTLSAAFAVASDNDLKIAQPALSHDSHYSYAATLRQRGSRLRYVNYIEMMCPIFRTDVLLQIEPLFSMGFESGIDLVWCNLVHEGPDEFAIIDDAVVKHTRRVGTLKSLNGFSKTHRYEDDIRTILDRFGLPWLSCVPYAMLTAGGRRISSRLSLLYRAAHVAAAIPQQPNMRRRARAIAVHLRHIACRRPLNIPITWPPSEA